MSAKRYYWDRKSDCDCEIIEQPDGAMVDYEDYTALEQQLAESHRALRAETTAHENTQMQMEKLAAENAVLKNFITSDCHVAHIEPETFYEEEVTRYVSADGYEPETPATDAFLAEVRAQGVEMFGQWLRDSADIFDKNSRHDWADQNRVSADKAGEFAEHLRKGVQS